MIPLLVGDFSWLGGSAAICEEDPAACLPPPTGGEGNTDPVPPPAGEDNGIDAFARTLPVGERRPYTTQYGGSLRRYFGGDSAQWGKYWTTANPSTRGEAQTILGLPTGPPPEPLNTAEFVVEGHYLAGSQFVVGRLASGATEVLIDNPVSLILNPIIRAVPQ